ncbi:MAG: hypothetical protein KAW17_02125 [Candidatus Eisenbacteria sp.]|nr:hypothetical protein [Candidatus Eisenbacteria bacterium]
MPRSVVAIAVLAGILLVGHVGVGCEEPQSEQAPKLRSQLDEDVLRRLMLYEEQRRSPGAAMVWSVVIPGAGHVYNKDYAIGGALFLFTVVLGGAAIEDWNTEIDSKYLWGAAISLRIADIGLAYIRAKGSNRELRRRYRLEIGSTLAGDTAFRLVYRF